MRTLQEVTYDLERAKSLAEDQAKILTRYKGKARKFAEYVVKKESLEYTKSEIKRLKLEIKEIKTK